ncbi:MAG: PEP-CTERM sorting domain-containing protein [bacterium]|nr:PEP-CTERM sorting domain-containing protein [bacterium]
MGFDDISAHGGSVPEPATVGVMALGCLLLGLMLATRRLEP